MFSRREFNIESLAVGVTQSPERSRITVVVHGDEGLVDQMMKQLEKICRVAEKKIPGAPHEVLLILDATTGQNALSQARKFTADAGVTGLILTKLDGTAKGGIVLAINREIRLPIKFIGIGEKETDLAPFDPEEFCQALFSGMREAPGA